MAILAFQKPDKVLMLEADSRFGKFEFRPLEPGFGITVGNALRRILLSSLEGFAINTIKIEGVEHEFASVPGVKEDVTNIILNLKQVRFWVQPATQPAPTEQSGRLSWKLRCLCLTHSTCAWRPAMTVTLVKAMPSPATLHCITSLLSPSVFALASATTPEGPLWI